MNRRWDIFCRVIDNYGDAGVCWRLARQLADEFNFVVRLWIDDLTVLKKIHAPIDSSQIQQISAGVTIGHWSTAWSPSVQAADVVIEAFACEIPDAYRTAMRAQHSTWINLEYLSAEEWVSGCHGLPSPQTDSGLKKYFFFPGFRGNTGGVLGERELPQKRRAFQSHSNHRAVFFQRFNAPVSPAATVVSLFAYRSAPIETLLQVWSEQAQPIICLVPEGQALAAMSRFFGEDLSVGSMRVRGSLTVVVLPFLSQQDYDRLLWSCDLNFVRGEDSFVRAQWAARPFVWQIYAQEEGAHWPKLDAFMALYGEHAGDERVGDRHMCGEPMSSATMPALHDFWRAWNGDGDIAQTWPAYAHALSELEPVAEKWAERLESGTNLAAALVQFCANQV